MKKKSLLLVCLIIFALCSCAQNIRYGTNRVDQSLLNQAFDITNILPNNYSRNGDVDYTKFLQNAIDKYPIVIMPNFPVLIDVTRGLILKSNSKIIFQSNSLLVVKENALESYSALSLVDIQNVDIFYPVIKGDRDKHLSEKGQWGMGINIRGSKNVKIFSPSITECWGDGIYISSYKSRNSEDITVDGGLLDRNRRNGISITSGKDIIIKNITIKNTRGQNPQSGIDIEPNNNYNEIKNIVIENVTTMDNGLHGIVVSTGSIVGKTPKDISVRINNHTDRRSKVGLGLAPTRAEKKFKGAMSGIIVLNGLDYEGNSTAAIRNYGGQTHTVKLDLNNLKVNGVEISRRSKQIQNFGQQYKRNGKADIKQ